MYISTLWHFDLLRYKNGATDESPRMRRNLKPSGRSGYRLTPRRPDNLAGGEAARADLDLDDLVGDGDARNLEVRLPGATGLVIGVRNVVTEGNALTAGVALVALDRLCTLLGELALHFHLVSGTSSMRAISAPSPLRWPVLRIRV